MRSTHQAPKLSWCKTATYGYGPGYVYDLRMTDETTTVSGVLLATVIGPYGKEAGAICENRYMAILFASDGPNQWFDSLNEAQAWCLATWRLEQ